MHSTSRSTNTPSSLQRAEQSKLGDNREAMASPVLAFALLSSHFPNRMNEISVAAMLKSKSWVARVILV